MTTDKHTTPADRATDAAAFAALAAAYAAAEAERLAAEYALDMAGFAAPPRRRSCSRSGSWR